MKRCPTCNKTFTDPTLSYCIEDGTPLAAVPDAEDEPGQVGTESSAGWTPPAYQPPSYTVPVESSKGGKPGRGSWASSVSCF